MDDAEQILRNALDEFGLGDLAPVLYQRFEDFTPDMSLDQKLFLIRDTEQYKTRFRANEARRLKGLRELSPTEIINAEREYQATLNVNQLPRSFYDTPDDFVSFLANDVSNYELQQRIDAGYNAIREANPEAIRQMKELYGVNEGELAAYFIDPEKTKPVLERKARAAAIGAEARLQAGMQLTQQQAEALATERLSPQDAQRGFSQISREQELYTPIAGEQGAITQEEQITGTFGTSSAAAQRIATRRRRRQAEFEAGGRFATGQTGITGLGTAQ